MGQGNINGKRREVGEKRRTDHRLRVIVLKLMATQGCGRVRNRRNVRGRSVGNGTGRRESGGREGKRKKG